MEKVSYALGLNVGGNIAGSGIQDLNAEQFAQGVKDALAGKPAISVQEAQQILNEYFSDLQQKIAEKNKAEGTLFLTVNSKHEGVKTLPSGLQYKVLQEGTGRKPTASDSVVCHYHGTLIDGTVFDSSVQRGQPATFGVSQVIKGWTEALQLMTEGSKWRLFIPSELAYGAQGAGAHIKPHTTLIFDVELLNIV
ncbi:MAG: FKBP-type peptidyl-prolyl cis-trans isomerase [Prevotellaceae bacterium]|nr:FKBP-type peptidyl-prolyl cis-trans isomerase [Prevotellaceae bacterium]